MGGTADRPHRRRGDGAGQRGQTGGTAAGAPVVGAARGGRRQRLCVRCLGPPWTLWTAPHRGAGQSVATGGVDAPAGRGENSVRVRKDPSSEAGGGDEH